MFLKNKCKFLFTYAFVLFILSAFYGILLRWNFTFPIPSFSYQNMLQSHSHVAFLGWGYLVSIGAIIQLLVKKKDRQRRVYNVCISIIAVTIILMLISFPLSGYKAFSIVLLSLFGLSSYVVSYYLLKDLTGNGYAVKLVRYGIYYYVLSSLATWFLAGVMVTQGKTDLYYNTVYFYLHFLYNGFFVFVLFGLLFKIFKMQQIHVSEKLQKGFFVYLNYACIPAYALSILWSSVSPVFYIIGFLAAVVQIISLLYLIKILQQSLPQIKWDGLSRIMLKFLMIAYGLKVMLQAVSAFPYFVEVTLALKPYFIIGYLHLFTLAFMSVFLLLILEKLNWIRFFGIVSKWGIILFLGSVLSIEILFFLNGTLLLTGYPTIWSYNIILLVFSCFIVIGLFLIFVRRLRKTKTNC